MSRGYPEPNIESLIARLDAMLERTPAGVAVCPPLQRALLERIAAELRERQYFERWLADEMALMWGEGQ